MTEGNSVFIGANAEELISEIESCLSKKLSGDFAILGCCTERFISGSLEDTQLLKSTEECFGAIVHELLNIRTTFEKMESIAISGVTEANTLHAYLATDVQSFFGCIQSICDYLAEGILLFFPNSQKGTIGFGRLTQYYEQAASIADPEECKLQEAMKSAGEWITVVRKTRNGMFHEKEAARVLIPNKEDDILFYISDASKRGLFSAQLDRIFYSKETPTYLKFKLVSSVILVRTLELANLIASLCKKKMEQRMQVKKPNVPFSVTIPDMSVPIYWLSLARCQLSAESDLFIPSIGQIPQVTSLITKETMLGFIDLVLRTNSQLSDVQQVKAQIVRIEALIRLLSSKNPPFGGNSRGESSFYTFRAKCLRNRYERNPTHHLAHVSALLLHVRQDIDRGFLALSRDIQTLTFEFLSIMIMPIPSSIPPLPELF